MRNKRSQFTDYSLLIPAAADFLKVNESFTQKHDSTHHLRMSSKVNWPKSSNEKTPMVEGNIHSDLSFATDFWVGIPEEI